MIFRKKTLRPSRKAGLILSSEKTGPTGKTDDPRRNFRWLRRTLSPWHESSEVNEAKLWKLDRQIFRNELRPGRAGRGLAHTRKANPKMAYFSSRSWRPAAAAGYPRGGRFRPTAVKALDHHFSSIRGNLRRAKTNCFREDKQVKHVLQAKTKKKTAERPERKKRGLPLVMRV